jgi:hypothetical protein
MKGIIFACVRDENDKPVFQVKRQYFQRSDYLPALATMKFREEVQLERTLDYNIFGTLNHGRKFYCVSTSDFPVRTCYEFMVEFRSVTSYDAANEVFKRYNEQTDIITECEELLETRKEETFRNIDIALERGKGLEKLITQAEEIENVTFDFGAKTKKLKQTHDCMSITLYVLIAGIFVATIATVTIVLIVKYAILK